MVYREATAIAERLLRKKGCKVSLDGIYTPAVTFSRAYIPSYVAANAGPTGTRCSQWCRHFNPEFLRVSYIPRFSVGISVSGAPANVSNYFKYIDDSEWLCFPCFVRKLIIEETNVRINTDSLSVKNSSWTGKSLSSSCPVQRLNQGQTAAPLTSYYGPAIAIYTYFDGTANIGLCHWVCYDVLERPS